MTQAIVTCRRCGQHYLDDGSNTEARRAFKANHGPDCSTGEIPGVMPTPADMADLEALARWEPRTSH